MKPNFLIFMTDQQRGDMQPTFGKAITPNLEKLAENGVVFRRAYCPSPHCCPSRATFFSGLYPSRHGVWNNVDLADALSRGLYDDVRLFSEDLKELRGASVDPAQAMDIMRALGAVIIG